MTLRKSHIDCSKCQTSLAHTEEFFYRNPGNKSGLSSVCIECRKAMVMDHRRKQRHVKHRHYERPRERSGKLCYACFDMPWRVPGRRGSKCPNPKCSNVRTPEPPVTLAYGAQWTENKTTFPATGGFE